MSKTIIPLILGLILGYLISYFGCQPSAIQSISELDIKNTDAYNNPADTVFLRPNDFFTTYKSNIESPKDLFAGVRVNLNSVKEILCDDNTKSWLYISIGLNKSREKQLLVSKEPVNGTRWRDNTGSPTGRQTPSDTVYIYSQLENGNSKLTMHVHSHLCFLPEANPDNAPWFNALVKATFPGTLGFASGTSKCPTACGGGVQGGRIAPI